MNIENMAGVVLDNIQPDDAKQLLAMRGSCADAAKKISKFNVTISQLNLCQMKIEAYHRVSAGKDLLVCYRTTEGTDQPYYMTATLSPFWKKPIMRAELFKRIFDYAPLMGLFVFDIEEL